MTVKTRVIGEQRNVGAAHDAQIDAVEHRHDQDAGEQRVDPETQMDERRRATGSKAAKQRNEARRETD